MKNLLLVFTFLLICTSGLSAKTSGKLNTDKTIGILIVRSNLKLNSHFNADTGKKALPKDRSKIDELILNLNRKIKELEKEQELSLEKERSFFGKLTQGLGDNILEQKLNYYRSLCNFLTDEKDKLKKLGIGVKKVGETVSDIL